MSRVATPALGHLVLDGHPRLALHHLLQEGLLVVALGLHHARGVQGVHKGATGSKVRAWQGHHVALQVLEHVLLQAVARLCSVGWGGAVRCSTLHCNDLSLGAVSSVEVEHFEGSQIELNFAS